MFGESFTWQGLCLAFAAFIPTDIPTLYSFSFVCPNLSHNIQSIVVIGVRIKRKNEHKKVQNGDFLETCMAASNLSVLQVHIIKKVMEQSLFIHTGH
jgi:hypothetical protein